MKKKYIILIIIAILILFLLTKSLNYSLKEKRIINSIEKANYCETDSDCQRATSKYPICQTLIHKNEFENIEKLMQSYKTKPNMGACIKGETISCENNMCKEIYNLQK